MNKTQEQLSVPGPLYEIKHLTKVFKDKQHSLIAVNNFNLSIYPGQTIGLVGESGSGKTTVGRCMLRLIPPTEGILLFEGLPLLTLSGAKLREVRRKLQMIFQDPDASLNPRMTVRKILEEALVIHSIVPSSEREHYIEELLDTVKLSKKTLDSYPHELSGGQKQRVGIARSLSVQPKMIVCDEPLSALDVSVRAQIVNLLNRLKKEKGLTYFFITHDLATLRYIASHIAVMYFGHLVEYASNNDLYTSPLHPYTQALLDAVPNSKAETKPNKLKVILQGEIPNPFHPPRGCPFHTRCPKAMPVCMASSPQFKEIQAGHFVACHLDQ